MSMNASQVRVVDPILTDHARGYSNAGYVGEALFPTVDVPIRGFKRIEFGRDSFRRRQTRRAPGTPIRTMEFGHEGRPVSLHQEALGAVVAIEHQEDAQQTPGIDLLTDAVDLVQEVIALEKECQRADVARNAASYAASNKMALTGNDKWSSPDSNPKVQVADAKEVIRSRIGRRPNTLLVTGSLITSLSVHPMILAHFSQTSDEPISLAKLKSYFEVDNLVGGDGIFDNADGTTSDIWGTEAILAYVAPKTGGSGRGRNLALPSYGYTYQLKGRPLVTPTRWEAGIQSWQSDVIDEFSAELVGADAGFLFQGAR
ncbi:hypothetical protein CG471_11755 [Sphingobium sp. IP1]|uniref:hypothetical protein n=1 Tax=Sphingobium sp. IP1 TaxID=2021637 RepID=UPI000C068A6D|nr:hypothetical protein [Sphingobium sp. IP1]PHP19527.1 hypothetical protein CG471_11755 [Sphingobium sp. IP1]